MRLYVLVTSFRPLQYWMYREGFARFSGAVFSMNSIDPMIHLTNVAIQKTREGYDQSKGCKWLFHQLKRYLVAKHGLQPVTTMLAAIDRVILHSLQAVQVLLGFLSFLI
jgi:tubulin polyglutamylase TTLL9